MKIFSRIKIKIDKIINSSDLFVIEKWFLRKLGMWPDPKLSKWKILAFLLCHICFNFIPLVNFISKALHAKEYVYMVHASGNLLLVILIGFIPLTILFRGEYFRKLITELEANWNRYSSDEFPMWGKRRQKIVKMGNKILFFVLCFVHMSSCIFLYSTSVIKFVRYVIFNQDDSDVERSTYLRVEWVE